MFGFKNLAPKLLISEILVAPVLETEFGLKLTSHGIYYARVQIQGNLEGDPEQGYCVRDATGSIAVTLPPSKATDSVGTDQQLDTDIPVIIVGNVFETQPSPEEAEEQDTPIIKPERYIEATKLIQFSSSSNISEQWMLEVNELALHVYPQMASATTMAAVSGIESKQ